MPSSLASDSSSPSSPSTSTLFGERPTSALPQHERLLTMAQFQQLADLAFQGLMASSDVDQKFLGRYAKKTHDSNPFLSAMLYKLLGLSVLLSKKLVRARRLRRLDTTRDTKSLQLYHHIIWLSREGLTILEEYVLPMVDSYSWELRVLANKLRASFYHIFVLFHNQPSIHRTPAISSALSSKRSKERMLESQGSLRRSPPNMLKPKVADPGPLPPGLQPITLPKPAATFLLPARNYIPDASAYFSDAAEMADKHLFGSHPIRLSVKTEYAAYLYDCVHDGEASRKLAQAAVRDVYNAPEGMDDDMFEDAADMVGILGKMMTRGIKNNGSTTTPSSATPLSTPKPAPPPKNGHSRKSSKNGHDRDRHERHERHEPKNNYERPRSSHDRYERLESKSSYERSRSDYQRHEPRSSRERLEPKNSYERSRNGHERHERQKPRSPERSKNGHERSKHRSRRPPTTNGTL